MERFTMQAFGAFTSSRVDVVVREIYIYAKTKVNRPLKTQSWSFIGSLAHTTTSIVLFAVWGSEAVLQPTMLTLTQPRLHFN